MAKNRVAPDRPIRKRDNFFTKTQANFKAKNKREQFKTKPNLSTNSEITSPSNSDFFISSTDKKIKTKTNIKAQSNPPENPDNETSNNEKKPFDKKTWRLQKYSRKYKLQQWEDKRKKAVLRGYYRSVKDEDSKFDVQKIYQEDGEDEEVEEGGGSPSGSRIENKIEPNENSESKNVINEEIKGKPKSKAFKKAHLEFERIQNEKQQKKEEALKRKQEREEALKEYRKKKTEKYKKLSKKTKKGQPIMKDRMELLLEKIQKSVS